MKENNLIFFSLSFFLERKNAISFSMQKFSLEFIFPNYVFICEITKVKALLPWKTMILILNLFFVIDFIFSAET